ncbi:MAG: hypothetical protein EON58_14810, partial [Alphaproteobacteria bacterium]
MQKNIAILLSFATLSLLHGCAKPDLKAEAQKAIDASYAAEDAATAAKNPDIYFAAYSTDCLFMNEKGQQSQGIDGINRNKAALRMGFSIPNTTWKRTHTITDFSLNNKQGTAATVSVTQGLGMTIGGSRTVGA